MTHRQAMEQRCKCGGFPIGGWMGEHKTGRPNFSRVSAPKWELSHGMTLCEEHTLNACFTPQKIA